MISMKKFQKLSKEKFAAYVTVTLVTMFLKVHEKAKNENSVIKFILKEPLGPLFL